MAKGIKTGGRKSGTPNLVTKDIRETIKQFIETNIQTIQYSFDELEPYQKMQTLTRLLDFVTPKLKQVEETIKNIDNAPRIEIRDVSGLSRSEVAEWQRLDELTRRSLSEDKTIINLTNQTCE